MLFLSQKIGIMRSPYVQTALHMYIHPFIGHNCHMKDKVHLTTKPHLSSSRNPYSHSDLLVIQHHPATLSNHTALHNMLFGQYVFLSTKRAENYHKIYVLIYHSTYICPSLFGWKENLTFKETVTDFQTPNLGFLGHFDRF